MRRVLLALLLAAPALVPAKADGVPEALRGTWVSGSCAAPVTVLHVTARAAVRLPGQGPARLLRFRSVRDQAGWTLGTGPGAEAPRLMLRAEGEGLAVAEPDPKLRDDRLPGTTAVSLWHRCLAGSAATMLLHGEGLAFLGALERLEAACQAGPMQGCIAALVTEADVSGDGRLSVAEIARLLRGAGWAVAVQDGATTEAMAGAAVLGAIAGLGAARGIVSSLDYDGDGTLSPAELAQDRLAFPPGTGSEGGQPGTIETLAEGAGLLRSLIERAAAE